MQAHCLVNPDLEDVRTHLQSGEFFWMDLQDPDADEVNALGELLKLHPLTIEDLRTFHQNPRFDEFPGYAYMVAYGVDAGVDSGSPLLREVHLVVSGAYVISVHQKSVEALASLRARYQDVEMRSEQQLVYSILDALAGTFFPVLARIDDDIDSIEDDVLAQANESSLQRIFSLKRDLVAMRRVVTPLRDMFARNTDRIADLPGMQGDDRLYFRDLYDTMIRVADLVDSYRDLLSGATDLYLATVANRQGEVNKQLTIIATIFLPLTFLTGFFGQNFSFLVNHVVDTTWSFIVLGLGLLAVSVAVFVWYFKRNRWI
ncbi:MAG TPA: magnesium transporter CorA family protein [Solirubrobacteraceae bacterium]|jgi:magnesium transporter|nr:magnesium transporter CorA family protein [Solirubrobacteraceae bacterium]